MDDDDRPTVALDPRTITGASWPLVIAILEQIGAWAVLAVRLGILALLQECIHAMARPDAPASLVNEARALVEALAKQPWDRQE